MVAIHQMEVTTMSKVLSKLTLVEVQARGHRDPVVQRREKLVDRLEESSCSSQPRANRRRNDVRGGRDRGQLFRGTGSLVSGHGDQGIYIRGDAGSPIALLTLTDTVITHNRIGIYADFIGQVHLVHSTVTLNSTGVFTLNGGVIYTAGNNSVIGNLLENFVGGANVVFFKSDLTT
jgi:hypothetical protein